MNPTPSPAAKAKGAFLKKLREVAEMEQDDVASLLAVSRVTVSRWETARREPSRSVVRELVMLYMSRGAKPDADEAAALGIEIPRRTADRPPGTSAYATPDRLAIDGRGLVREGSGSGSVAVPENVLRAALAKTEANLVRLSEISGYAKGVLEMMRAVTAGQEQVVASLAPWVRHEERLYDTDPQLLEDAAADVMRDAERVAQEQARKAAPKPKRKSAG